MMITNTAAATMIAIKVVMGRPPATPVVCAPLAIALILAPDVVDGESDVLAGACGL
jgi:hypothetical protein